MLRFFHDSSRIKFLYPVIKSIWSQELCKNRHDPGRWNFRIGVESARESNSIDGTRCARIIFFISTISRRENYSGGSRMLLYNEGNGYVNRTKKRLRFVHEEETKRRSFQGCLGDLSSVLIDPQVAARGIVERGLHTTTETSPPFRYTWSHINHENVHVWCLNFQRPFVCIQLPYVYCTFD